MKKTTGIVILASALIGVFGSTPAAALAATDTATGTFTAATDTAKPANDTNPRGSVTFTQVDLGAINAKGAVTGLTPNRTYITVPYLDGGCAPTPGVTAYPSASWTTDGTGAANFSVPLNPKAINPVSPFTVAQTKSISIREVLVPGQTIGPVTTPNAPNPITEACDTAPVVSSK